jgi:6-phosphogluconate dehydrogenase
MPASGGVWGLERDFCQMIGGEPAIVQHLDPLFAISQPPGTIVEQILAELRGPTHPHVAASTNRPKDDA